MKNTLVYIVDSNERPNLNSGRPPSTHFTSDDTDYMHHITTSMQQQQFAMIKNITITLLLGNKPKRLRSPTGKKTRFKTRVRVRVRVSIMVRVRITELWNIVTDW